jgi:phosphoglycerate dehydrogenase-like enzyme
MTIRILVPDAPFADPPDEERAAAGAGVEIEMHRGMGGARIPDESWRAADGVVLWHLARVDARVVERLDRCRIVVRAGVGFDNLDLAACGRRKIAVCNVPDYGTAEVADHAIGLMLALARGILSYHEAVRADPVGGWRWDLVPPGLRRLTGRIFGVVGLGRIGTAVALRARSLGMRVLFQDPYQPDGLETALGFERAQSLPELLGAADVVSLHAPLTEETRGLIGEAAIAALKPGAILINTARGGIVDLDALRRGLREGKVAAVALDVLPEEPPDPDHPLIRDWRAGESWIAGRLILTPHAAFYSPEGFAFLRRKAIGTAVAFLRDGTLRNCVNRDLL